MLALEIVSRPTVPAVLLGRSRSITNNYRRSQNFDSGFTSSYDPTQDTGRGPIFNRERYGVPQFYPRDLKKRLDDYVIGQNRAKKTICTTIFNHYQGLRRRRHLMMQDIRLREKLKRQKFSMDREFEEKDCVYPLEDDFPGHNDSVRMSHPDFDDPEDIDDFYIPEDTTSPQHIKIDKSNLLLIGPTGVGKTYILETLSKKLNVPFTISDCNSFTQAGYIGQDVETCIERLLIEANYDTLACERGIVVLDEFDKIAKREVNHSRDVGGEGVQQALLKLVEGTKITINVKDNKSSRTAVPTSTMGSPNQPPPPPLTPSGRTDQYTIDTTNILFVFCGAFVGLEKAVLRRVNKASMGFGSPIRGSKTDPNGRELLPREMYAHLPHQPALPDIGPLMESSQRERLESSGNFTPLDLVTPADLQAFGFIPELIGRMHNTCVLSPLSLDELFSILTEPRNSLVAQYTALFETYPSRLVFTQKALYAIAKRAQKNETGARGLKMEMERVLAEPMYDTPMPYVLITEACVNGTEKALYWGKDGHLDMLRTKEDEDGGLLGSASGPGLVSDVDFEHFREAGQSGA